MASPFRARALPATNRKRECTAPRAPTAASSPAPLARALGNRGMQQLLDAGVIQARLRVSQPQDACEQEADRVADRVMRMPAGDVAARARVNAAPRTPLVQRRHDDSHAGGDGVPQHVSSGWGAGQPLDPQTRDFFETRFGEDFGDVRVHVDADADRAAHSIDAQAFTAGDDIVFRRGHYAPHTEAGRHLLAHELTHTVQQGGAQNLIARQVAPRSVADMSYEDRLGEALWAALPAFGTWLAISIAILVLSVALVWILVTALLELIPPAWVAWVTATLGVIGVLMGIVFFADAVRRAGNAWSELDSAIRGATTHADLQTAGENFGREMAVAVVEMIGAVLSAVGGARGLLGRGFGLRPPPPNGRIPGTPARGSPPPEPVAPPEPPVVEPPVAEPPVAEAPPPRAPVRAPVARVSLTREAMRQLLQQIWDQTPLLQRLAAARGLSGARLVAELRAILATFQAETGVIVEEVANGVVQAARGAGNLASLRSSPGRLQIEAAVFENPELLLTEVTHELAYYYSRLATGSPALLGEGPLSALELLEMVIQQGGNVGRVLPLD